MATPPTAGTLLLLESDGTDNDDWITDHSGDPDNIDLSKFTLGTDYCYTSYPEHFAKQGNTGILIRDSGGGKSFSEKNAMRGYIVNMRALLETLTLANQFDQFIMSDRHTSGASAIIHVYYLVIYRGTNSHVKFVDGSGNQKKYCKGEVTPNYRIIWDESNHQNFPVTFTFRSVW